MTSIEPRFRGYYPATDEQTAALCPILAIPDWDAQAVSNLSLNSIEAATAASPAEATDAADWNHVANEQLSGDDGPAAGRLLAAEAQSLRSLRVPSQQFLQRQGGIPSQQQQQQQQVKSLPGSEAPSFS